MEFFLSFVPDLEDALAYQKKTEAFHFMARIRKIFFPFILFMIMGFMFDIYYAVSGFCLFMVTVLSPTIVNFSNRKRIIKSEIFKRPVELEFYDSHIVQKYLPGGKFKGIYEKHIPFRSINAVFECNEYLFFVSFVFGVVTVPKRVITHEQYEMLSNLTENLFSDKYQRI